VKIVKLDKTPVDCKGCKYFVDTKKMRLVDYKELLERSDKTYKTNISK
jgi:hypothetical protein